MQVVLTQRSRVRPSIGLRRSLGGPSRGRRREKRIAISRPRGRLTSRYRVPICESAPVLRPIQDGLQTAIEAISTAISAITEVRSAACLCPTGLSRGRLSPSARKRQAHFR